MVDQPPPPTPGAWGTPLPPERPPAPGEVRLASAGVFVLAAFFALNVIAVLAARDMVTSTLEITNPELSESQIEAAASGAAAVAGTFGLVVVALLVWFGVMLRRQRNWARIAVSVLLAIGLLANLNTALGGPPVVQLFSAVAVILIGGVLLLLWRAQANLYFRARSG